jgi:WD40 repeat protein
LRVWSTADGREIRGLESWDRSAARLLISSDGKWLLACTDGGPVGLWDLRIGRRMQAPGGLPEKIGCAAFSPESDLVALGDEEGVVHLWAINTGREIRKILPALSKDNRVLLLQQAVRAVAWSADGRTLAVGYQDEGLVLFDPRTGAMQGKLKVPPRGVAALAFSADGRLLAAVDIHSLVHVYETTTGQEVRRTPGWRPWMLSVAFAPDGRTLAFAGGTTIHLRLYHASLQQRTGGEPDFTIRLWDIIENKEVRRLTGHAQQVESLSFCADGTRLLSQGADGMVLSWDVAALLGHPAPRGPALSASRLTELWTDLASHDAVRGQKAVGELIRSPDSAVALLDDKLKPAPAPPRQRIAILVADLDSDEFARRDKAARELEQLGEIAAPALRNALTEKPSLEARKRLEALLETIDGHVMTPEQLRLARALQILESIGTTQTQRVLERLVGGADGAQLTQEAKAALQRLNRRHAQP